MNDDGYIDIHFLDFTARGLDKASITDAGQEFKFLVLDADGETWVEPLGVGINGIPLEQSDGTFRYFFSGQFEPGVVRVVFLDGSFTDTAGAANLEEEQQFIVVSNAPAFQITIAGDLIYRTGFTSGLYGNVANPEHLKDLLKMVKPVMEGIFGDNEDEALQTLSDIIAGVNTALDFLQPFITEPMLTVTGFLRMGSELLMDGSEIVGARTTLDAAGGISVFLLGPVGAAAGRVVLQADNEHGLSAWGVMELQAKLDFLNKVGIDLQGFASFQFNTTDKQQIESLTLPGFGEPDQNGEPTDLTQSYEIEPYSLMVAAAGKLLFHVPTFDEADPFGQELFRISAVASLSISAEGLQMFAKGDLEIGPPEIRLLDIDALGVFVINDQGFAGDVQVSVAAGDIAAIKDYFEFGVSARVLFNVTGEDQEVKILDRFLPFLTDEFIARLDDCTDAASEATGQTFVNGATKCYTIGGAPPPRPHAEQAPAGPYVVITAVGDVMIAEVFRLHGDFYFEVNSTPEFFMTVNASLALDPLGAVAVSGTLQIDRNGAYGGLQLGASLELGPLEIFGAAQFEFNTHDAEVTIDRYKFDFNQRRVTDEREAVVLQPGASGSTSPATWAWPTRSNCRDSSCWRIRPTSSPFTWTPSSTPSTPVFSTSTAMR